MRSTCSPRSGRSSSAAATPPAKTAAASRSAPPGAQPPAMRIGLARGLQVIGEQVVGELAPHRFAHIERIAEVDAAPDAHLLVLFRHLHEAVEAELQARVRDVGHGKALRPGAEIGVENASIGRGVYV